MSLTAIPAPTLQQRVCRLLAFALLCAGPLALAWWALPRALETPLPAVTGTHLACVSYAPFRRTGHSPFDPDLVIPPAAIDADLALIARVSRCVRTYGVGHGLDALPALAARHGLRVRLGVWISADPAANARELATGLRLARAHRDVVDLLIVGNEVLLRRDLQPAQLAQLLAAARREAAVPIAYADVWEFWLRHAEALRGQVDLAAIHILPYWEDHPVGIDGAARHVREIAAKARAALAPLPLWIGETGWPAAGRQRGAASPGVVEQARLVRELVAMPPPEARDFNLIEAFDQPWKRALEGAVGGAWGMFDADGRQRIAFSGSVPGDATARAVGVALVLGAFGAAIGAGVRRHGPAALCAALLAGAHIAGLLPLQWRLLVEECRVPGHWLFGALLFTLTVGAALDCALRLLEALDPRAAGLGPPRPAWRDFLFPAWLFAAASYALMLLFDGRYRPLVWPMLLSPALLALALALLGRPAFAPRHNRAVRILGAACAASAVALVVSEGVANGAAWAVALGLACAGLAVEVAHRSALGQAPTRSSTAIHNAGAAGPAP
ncbi:MAG: hypothetical protein JNM79_02285 [Burkholderiales bacterium]|nr:hypothetical protein [Burkholderiales bacterium]